MKKALIISLAFVVLTVFSGFAQKKVKGNGNVIKENVRISDFTELEISGAFQIELQQTGESSLTIEAEENIMDYIEVKNSGDVLKIGFEDNISVNNIEILTLYINVNQLREINITGAVDLKSVNTLKFDRLLLDISGAGNLDLDLNGNSLDCEFSGAANIDLKGTVTNVDFDISGAGKLDGSDMNTENFDLDLSGVGAAQIYVTNQLDVEISGMGVVSVDGNPRKVSKDIGIFGVLDID